MADPRITDKVAEVKQKIRSKIDAEIIEVKQKIADAIANGTPITEALAALDDIGTTAMGEVDKISENVIDPASGGTGGETNIPPNN